MSLSPLAPHSVLLTGGQVHAAAMDTLQKTLSDFEINGYQYTQNEVWDVLFYASVHRVSIKAACTALDHGPSYNWIYTVVKEELLEVHDVESLERQANALLETTFPKRLTHRAQKVAIDAVLIPYYGEETTKEIRRSQAKTSTTKFFCYASAYLIKKNKRVTLCCTFVRPEDTLLGVLTRLVQRVHAFGIHLKRLYLDREFAQVAILRYLQQQPFVSVVALPKKGHTFQNLQQGKQSVRTSYTMTSSQEGQITFPVWRACRYRKGRAKKPGVQYLFFAVLGDCTSSVLQVAEEYRHRFGIESSYRIMHQARAKTTSRDPAMRLLLVALAFFLVNLWVWCQWQMLLITRRRGHRPVTFTLDTFRHFVARRIEHIYSIVTHLKL